MTPLISSVAGAQSGHQMPAGGPTSPGASHSRGKISVAPSLIISPLASQAVSDYKAKVNKDCQIKLDTENWLGADW